MPPLSTVTQELFSLALDLPPQERAAFLADACAGNMQLQKTVTELLAAHEAAGDFLTQPEISLPDSPLLIDSRIGPYTLRKIIGEGGYGTVYLADQDAPLRRRVAFKVIKPGMDTRQVIARFDLERQALALMDHPHIAKVLDAGATPAGRPYFVMEYVDGLPLISFAREHRLNLRQRLALFLDVCSAIQHAHEKGIIHRDLKPANILVSIHDGKPFPKVIDFGIAKALRTDDPTYLQTLTQTPQMLGTPQYMSPEQAALGGVEIDHRTDVYSLGAILYELLAGMPPFESEFRAAAGFADIPRILREVDPVPPSAALTRLSETLARGSPGHAKELRRLAGSIRRDLDWITHRAMEKDPSRRYESVAALGDDIRLFLADKPIHAGPPSRLHAARKFLRRNRAVFVMLVLAMASVALGLAIASLHKTSLPAPVIAQPSPPQKPPLLPGLSGKVYAGSQFETLVASRTDASIDFAWPRGVAPAPAITPPHYSIRWTGILRVPATGLDEIGVQADDGARLFLDGVEYMQATHAGKHIVVTPIPPGDHTLQLDYWNRISEGRVILWWKPSGNTQQIVPTTALFHAAPQPPTPTTPSTKPE